MKIEIGSRITESQTLPDLDGVIDKRSRYNNRRRHHLQIRY